MTGKMKSIRDETAKVLAEVRGKAETLAAIRWANNMLVEVLGNHGERLDGPARDKLKAVVTALDEAERAMRAEK